MADFLSRLAARTLGVASVAQPATASMFAQGPALAGNYPLEAWQEHESAGDILVPPANMPVEKSEPTFSHAMSSSLSFMSQADPSVESPEYSFSNSEALSINTRASQSQNVVPVASAPERIESAPSPLVSEYTALATPMPEAHASLREEIFYPDQPAEKSMQAAQRTSLRGERRVTRGYLDELRSRSSETVHDGSDSVPLSNVHGSSVTASERGQRTFMSRRSAVRHNGINNNAPESLVGQERRTITQSTNVSGVRPDRDPGAQPDASSRSDGGRTLFPTDAPRRSIMPEVIRSQPIVGNGQQIETQVIEASPPEPTIQVTIGRVEVRATPPPPAQPQSQQRAAPPIMSLDQYLQQRSKGGER